MSHSQNSATHPPIISIPICCFSSPSQQHTHHSEQCECRFGMHGHTVHRELKEPQAVLPPQKLHCDGQVDYDPLEFNSHGPIVAAATAVCCCRRRRCPLPLQSLSLLEACSTWRDACLEAARARTCPFSLPSATLHSPPRSYQGKAYKRQGEGWGGER